MWDELFVICMCGLGSNTESDAESGEIWINGKWANSWWRTWRGLVGRRFAGKDSWWLPQESISLIYPTPRCDRWTDSGGRCLLSDGSIQQMGSFISIRSATFPLTHLTKTASNSTWVRSNQSKGKVYTINGGTGTMSDNNRKVIISAIFQTDSGRYRTCMTLE